MENPVTEAAAPFVCPRDRGALRSRAEMLVCEACGARYPAVGGIPVLINDASSVFAVADYASGPGYGGASYGRAADRAPGFRRLGRRVARRLRDVGGMRHFGETDALLAVRAARPAPRVLVIGSGGLRHGGPGDRVMHTDVAFGPHVDAIADAHDLPFPDGAFDLVLAVAVLEHVADPQRCVAEFWRVLDAGGHVYAVTPFLQPVHMGAHDFTRFTPLGHRRLFRRFDGVEEGMAVGLGSVGFWVLGAMLEGISGARRWRSVARTAALGLAPLRVFDRVLRAPAALDAAGACFFFGRKRDVAIPDRVLIRAYRGGFRGVTHVDGR